MKGKIPYQFSAIVWQYKGDGAWHFVSLPLEIAKEIRENLQWMEEGWGRLKAVAKIGETQWDTAIWFDTKHQTYILPLKATIRKKENIRADESVEVTVWV